MFEDAFAIAIDTGAPAIPVAEKVTLPESPTAPAVRVFAPAMSPRVQLPTVAMPDAFDVAVAPVTEPPPLATEKFTVVPLTGFPFASVIFTDGAVATAVPTTAVCELPPLIAIEPTLPAVAVAVNVTIRSAIALVPAKPETAATATVAVRVFVPTEFPRRQLPTVATPASFVV